MPAWMHLTKAGRFWARHRHCSVVDSPLLGNWAGYYRYHECQQHRDRLYEDAGVPYLPYWV